MKITAEPRSDQWNADDFHGGSRTFTVADVRPGTAEQKYDIALEGEERVWRPPLTVLRILIAAWGDEAAVWKGRRATLYRDDSIRFGRETLGGIRVSHLSHLEKPLEVRVADKRGSRKDHVIQPLIERDFLAELALTNGDLDAISALGKSATQAGADAAVIGQIRDAYNAARESNSQNGGK